MGYQKLRCLDNGLVVEDDVQVDDSGTEADRVALAAGPPLNPFEGVQ
jgi:hypothetical protein